MNKEIKVSVRNLVEFVLRSGDLDSTFMGASRALEGTRGHQKVQNSYDENCESEVVLKHSFKHRGFSITLEGRADGILKDGYTIVIDEIKTTTRPLESIDEDYNQLHWAQGKCYAYIYSMENNLEEIDVQLTYYQIDYDETKIFRKQFSRDELEYFFYSLMDKYIEWIKLTSNWSITRDESIQKLDFPFETYRTGQRELAVGVYKTILDKKNLFVQAPTGIGKTISTMFPAVKSIREGLTYKIFYLTAKTITRQVALDSIIKMAEKGLRIKTVVLTAKEKICFNEEVNCTPENCPYAKGHYDRVNHAIMDLLANEDIITREVIESYGQKHKVCPFEYSLDLCLFADCIICDYNYVFDPRVSLKRFFQEGKEDFLFLIDEAHNLVDRAREMYSVEIYKEPFLEYKKYFEGKNLSLSKVFGKLNSFMLKTKKWYDKNEQFVQKDKVDEIYSLVKKATEKLEPWLLENKEDEKYKDVLDIYFNLVGFIRIWDFYDERYVTYGENTEDIMLKLYCLDPSYVLGETLKKGRSAIFFSATLTPIDYFKEILGGNGDDYTARAPSPFDSDNLGLFIVDNVSTRYKDRNNTYKDIVKYVEETVRAKEGNYLVFFPSYKYMELVHEEFSERNPDIKILLQSSFMKEDEREVFLEEFNDNGGTMVAFAVLGGIFSEGIDLIGDKLIGAIIVGVGLPQICLERNIIREYFQEKNNLGYEYSYLYPGMNKVLQAAGRVIRTEEDRGIILLIDDRFTTYKYKQLYPREWVGYRKINNLDRLKTQLEMFWCAGEGSFCVKK